MPPPTRRAVLGGCLGVGAVAIAGCVDRRDGGSTVSTTTEATDCTATHPRKPTTAATSPRAYPERPSQLSTETVRSYVTDYERAYQYNAQLAAHPQKIGRLNDLTVDVKETTVESAGARFTASVTGDRYYDIVDRDDSTATAPETPTETPLPMGRGPFSASYVVETTFVRREGTVVECW